MWCTEVFYGIWPTLFLSSSLEVLLKTFSSLKEMELYLILKNIFQNYRNIPSLTLGDKVFACTAPRAAALSIIWVLWYHVSSEQQTRIVIVTFYPESGPNRMLNCIIFLIQVLTSHLLSDYFSFNLSGSLINDGLIFPIVFELSEVNLVNVS